MPPPFGFTSAARSSSPASCRNCSATDAKASFTSTTAMSSQPRPARPSARSDASGFPCSISRGSTPASPNDTNRARGSSPSREQAASLATSTTAAPSQIWLEFPAVTFPSGRNAGGSAARASAEVSARGVSSSASNVPTCGFETSIGTISLPNRPSSAAASARLCDSSEYASSSSREKLHSSAISSAEIPCGTISHCSSSFSERSPPLEPIGTRDIDSTPADTTRSSWPDQIAAAALKFDCIDEPHCRSTVVPATDSGQPATSGAMRPMFQPCSPTCDTQPIWTSSTSAGSNAWRPTRSFSTCPASSSARIFDSDPFRLPIGDRTASTIRASRIENSVQAPFARDALQLVLTALLELDSCACHEVLHGLRDEHLAALRRGGNPGAAAHSEAGHLALMQLAFTRVYACTYPEPEPADALATSLGAADGARRSVERGEEPVPGRVLLLTAIARELAANEQVVPLEQLAPAPVAELRRPLRRPDDVGEEHRRENAVRNLGGSFAAREPRDLFRYLR